MNAKIDKEKREHPERFDFGDIPTAGFSPEYSAMLDKSEPPWLKAMQEKAQAALANVGKQV